MISEQLSISRRRSHIFIPEHVGESIPATLKDDNELIRSIVAAYPEATLTKLCKLLIDAGGRSLTRSAMWSLLKQLNLSTQRSRGTYAKDCRPSKVDEEVIRTIVAEHPDAKIKELCELLKDAGGPSLSNTTMWVLLKRLNLSWHGSREGKSNKTRNIAAHESKIREAVAAHPYATIDELCKHVRDAGGPSLSRNTMWVFLKRLNLSTQPRKKPKPKSNNTRARSLAAHESKIREAVAAHPYATIDELCQHVRDAGGPNVPCSVMNEQLKRLGLIVTAIRGRRRKFQNNDEAIIRATVEANSNATISTMREAVKSAGIISVTYNPMRTEVERLQLKKKSRLIHCEDIVRSVLTTHPNATLVELCDLVQIAGGPQVSRRTMSRMLNHLGISISRNKPNVKNRVDLEVEKAVIALAIEQPAYGLVRASKYLKLRGVCISPGGVRCILMRNDLETFEKRIKALEAISAQENFILTEAQLAALEPAKQEKEEHDQIETERLDYLGVQATNYVGTLIRECKHLAEGKMLDRQQSLVGQSNFRSAVS